VVIVMAPGATDEDIAGVVSRVEGVVRRGVRQQGVTRRSSGWSATSTPSTTSTSVR
jgi:hypothetical protein